MEIKVKTANDLISDCVDAFFAGNEEVAGHYLSDAMEEKISDKIVTYLKDLPEFN